ncbi:MAG: archaeosine biosynthesis radical SAM protein RaSEA [Candidatus Thermoplasmatota archaeon]
MKMNEPIGCWEEKDENSFVIILRTKGCSWAKCHMCGYKSASMPNISDENILKQFEYAMNRAKEKYNTIKIYNSGSFFDTTDLSEKLREKILLEASEKGNKVIVESRPEYINEKVLEEAKNACNNLEIAMGLESANNNVLSLSVNKGFTFEDYISAAKLIVRNGISLRAYILIKPIFLTENEGIIDSISSALRISEYANTISFNPVNVQKNTFLEKLWKEKKYRPPWLWSVLEVLLETKKKVDKQGTKVPYLVCYPVGGGKIRGTHNCFNCDFEILKKIRKFSLSQDISLLSHECKCKELWKDILEIEGFGLGSALM